MQNDLPPWSTIYQQSGRWMETGCLDALVYDLRVVLRIAAGKKAGPSTAISDSRIPRWTPGSRSRTGHNDAKRRKGSKLHMAVDTLGHLPALHDREDRAESID